MTYTGGNAGAAESVDATGQVGARGGEYLFLSDASYSGNPGNRRFVRLNTNVTHDWRDTLQRLVVGDLSASSGDLGSGVGLAGVGFSKVYQIDPYFLRYPLVPWRNSGCRTRASFPYPFRGARGKAAGEAPPARWVTPFRAAPGARGFS